MATYATVAGQTGGAAAAASAPVAAAATPADRATPELVVAALYQVISGPVGQARNWDRFRSLFAAGARLVAVAQRPDGTSLRRVMTPEDYIAQNGPLLVSEGFVERELRQEVQRFGGLVHVWTTYEGTFSSGSRPPMRGVNSIQLVQEGAEWKVLSVVWQAEQPGLALPAQYLPK